MVHYKSIKEVPDWLIKSNTILSKNISTKKCFYKARIG
jgi:hypothetical protein